MKLLLYCLKGKPYLANTKSEFYDIWDKPSKFNINELRIGGYSSILDLHKCENAPQNMAKVFTFDWNEEKSKDTFILTPIQPQHLVKILNRKKTMEVRKKILKEMEEC